MSIENKKIAIVACSGACQYRPDLKRGSSQYMCRVRGIYYGLPCSFDP